MHRAPEAPGVQPAHPAQTNSEPSDRPEPLVSVHHARLALARTHAAAQEASHFRVSGLDVERKAQIAMNLSWAVNILLLVGKAVAFGLSKSFSVLARQVIGLASAEHLILFNVLQPQHYRLPH